MTRSEKRMRQEQEARETHIAQAQERVRLENVVEEPEKPLELAPVNYESAYRELLVDLSRLLTAYRIKVKPRAVPAADPGYKVLQTKLAKGYTHVHVGRALGVKANTVTQWCKRQRVPRQYLETLRKLP